MEALAALRNDPATAGLTVVALTASVTPAEQQQMATAGFDGFLAKPISVREFPWSRCGATASGGGVSPAADRAEAGAGRRRPRAPRDDPGGGRHAPKPAPAGGDPGPPRAQGADSSLGPEALERPPPLAAGAGQGPTSSCWTG